MDLHLLGVSFDNCYLKVLLEADFEVLKYLNVLWSLLLNFAVVSLLKSSLDI